MISYKDGLVIFSIYLLNISYTYAMFRPKNTCHLFIIILITIFLNYSSSFLFFFPSFGWPKGQPFWLVKEEGLMQKLFSFGWPFSQPFYLDHVARKLLATPCFIWLAFRPSFLLGQGRFCLSLSLFCCCVAEVKASATVHNSSSGRRCFLSFSFFFQQQDDLNFILPHN